MGEPVLDQGLLTVREEPPLVAFADLVITDVVTNIQRGLLQRWSPVGGGLCPGGGPTTVCSSVVGYVDINVIMASTLLTLLISP